ncbi:MAG TPA: hypothetical protein PK842_08775 [Smithella sp.]|jgi:hypothetical protein|nr:hypothetical protein [Smithella sp.]NMC97454.1 hypothetical protein [Deltaproteobacteria bacterium]OQC54836.1 MAG: hypothetical protein BWX55_00293 [Deltaproteobacteria bacterium ADurb.Bin022]HNQ66380.1 hypothetical protein [Smithella sp.]HOE33379.1 hypothetical protein [Smithella sp.]
MAERDIQKQEEPTEAPRKKDLWDILQALGPALIAAAVAVIGSVYSYQQAQMTKASEMREVYTKIMTERENSDNNIRASMFQMLFNAMFDKDINSADTPDNVNQIKKRVMFLDVLSRNFDTVDIKPLFEDLDGELTRKMYNDRSYSDGAQEDYFALRSELRRIGRNLAVKQLNALASLPGTMVKTIVLIEDKDKNIMVMQDETTANGNGDTLPVEIKAQNLDDGKVEIAIDYQKAKASDKGFKAPSFIITFYDMPYIDNSVLDKDMRVGVVLTKYATTREIDLFRDRIDRRLLKDYEDLKAGGIAKYAELRLIKFPAKYTGHRDRPYLQEILQNLVENEKSVR